MLLKEETVGDYINFSVKANASLGVSSDSRTHFVTLLEDLNMIKKYKEETLYSAVSIVDRYLVNLVIRKEKAPDLILLTIVSTLIAAKLDEPL